MKNSNLAAAKRAKKDEFYTCREDIENELRHYESQFRDKIVYCNCDDPDTSEFWKFFQRNFNAWGLKRLIATHYEPDAANYSYMIEMNPGDAWDGAPVRKPIQSNGDFRSAACIELLEQADIVVTNPPFSLFREYVAQLMEYGKKFLIIGNINAVTYKEFFPLIKNNQVWIGPSIHSGDRKFYVPDDYPLEAAGCGIDSDGRRFIRVKGVRWFTNLDHKKRHEPLDLRGVYYDPDKYPKYDNYDAIEVSKTADIPCDYYEAMGVPITFLDKFCPEQFEIIDANEIRHDGVVMKPHGLIKDKDGSITLRNGTERNGTERNGTEADCVCEGRHQTCSLRELMDGISTVSGSTQGSLFGDGYVTILLQGYDTEQVLQVLLTTYFSTR